MNITGKITSVQNPKIRNILRLDKSREREKQNLFVIEGIKEVRLALKAGYRVESIWFCPEIFPQEQLEALLEGNSFHGKIFELTPEVYARIAYRDSTEGICLLAVPRKTGLDQLSLPGNPLLLMMEAVEKPGNLGAILRTADAAGASAVIVCDQRTDLYNPNVIRASTGCLFTVQVAICSNEEALQFARKKNIRIFAAALPAKAYYHETDFTGPSAIVMGTESSGLSDFWLKHADELIKIPMAGHADSLNVSTSAAILLYEAKRQRGFSV